MCKSDSTPSSLSCHTGFSSWAWLDDSGRRVGLGQLFGPCATQESWGLGQRKPHSQVAVHQPVRWGRHTNYNQAWMLALAAAAVPTHVAVTLWGLRCEERQWLSLELRQHTCTLASPCLWYSIARPFQQASPIHGP